MTAVSTGPAGSLSAHACGTLFGRLCRLGCNPACSQSALMSWEEVCGRLQAVLHALEQPAPRNAAAAEELCVKAVELHTSFSGRASLFVELGLSEDMRLAGARLSEPLAAQAGSFCIQPRWYGEGTWQLSVVASFTVLAQCAATMLRTAPAAEQERFCRSMLPLFHAGRVALAALCGAPSQADAHFYAQMLAESQLDLLAVLCSGRTSGDPVVTCLAAGLPPDALAAWLAGTLEFMPRTRMGCPTPRLQRAFVTVCVVVCTSAAFSDHTCALEHHQHVCRSLVTVLLSVVRAAAVAARLPPDRQRQAACGWQVLTQACTVLSSTKALQPAISAWIGAEGIDSLAAHVGSVMQLTAAALEPGGGCSEDWAHWQTDVPACLAGLLSVLFNSLFDRGQAQDTAGQLSMVQRRRLTAQVLPELRLLGAALRVALQACEQPEMQGATAGIPLGLLCRGWSVTLYRLVCLIHGSEDSEIIQPPGWADLTAWCSAAATGLRALPLLADARRQLQQLGDAAAAVTADGAAALPMTAAGDVAVWVAEAAGAGGRPSDPPPPDELAAVEAALWLLHSTAVRAVFWADAGGWQQLPCLQSGTHCRTLATTMLYFITAASALSQHRAASSPVGSSAGTDTAAQHICRRPSSAARGLAAMCVAHWEALQLLLASPTLAAYWGEERTSLLQQLSILAACGPAALATDPRLQALLRDALDSSSELISAATLLHVDALLRSACDYPRPPLHTLMQQLSQRFSAYSPICSLIKAPRLIAVLLTCGWLEQMVKDLPSLADTSPTLIGAHNLGHRPGFGKRVLARQASRLASSILAGLRNIGQAAAAELRDVANSSITSSSSSSAHGGSSGSGSGGGGSCNRLQLAALGAALDSSVGLRSAVWFSKHFLEHALPPERQLAAALQERWARPEQAEADRLEMAQAAAARSCAYLRCANLGGEGGPAAGQGRGSKRCSKCRAVWYCGTDCSHADWRGPGGHRRMCGALAASQQADMAAVAAQADAAD